MHYGDRIQWDHDGETWPGSVTGINPVGQADWVTITLDTDGLSYDVPESTVVRERSTMQADSIKIECDEDGFHLVLQLDEEIPLVTNEGRLDVKIHSCAEALHEQVNLIIGGWLAEGQAAARMPASTVFRCAPEDVDESGGYDRSDPKHPDWHSVHAGLYDNREKV